MNSGVSHTPVRRKKEKVRSLAQSNSYSTFLELAKADGEDVDSLRLLLILLNAHPKLTAHSRIFENLPLILDMPPITHAGSSGKLKWGNQVTIWKNLCNWVVRSKSKFEQDENLKWFVYSYPMVPSGTIVKEAPQPLNQTVQALPGMPCVQAYSIDMPATPSSYRFQGPIQLPTNTYPYCPWYMQSLYGKFLKHLDVRYLMFSLGGHLVPTDHGDRQLSSNISPAMTFWFMPSSH
ncbi:MAG: hypothetical protein HY016_05815 [Nitrosomonadales bacterium]|nr:hypothetical protein [Nitrosomonadales bacterium]